MDQQIASGYRATTALSQGLGTSPQEALAALMQQLSPDEVPTILILPYNRGDAHFTDVQQARLQELKARQAALSAAERKELDALIAASFDATVSRLQPLSAWHEAQTRNNDA